MERTPRSTVQVLDRLRDWLRRRQTPRFDMFLIVTATGAAGFLASFALLRLGLGAIWLRYALAVVLGYAVFFALIRLWVARHLRRAELAGVLPHPDELAAPDRQDPDRATTSQSNGSVDWLDLDPFGGDEVWLVLLGVAVASAVIASGWVVFIATDLLAEVLLDGLLSAGLYRRLRRLPRRHWLQATWRRTRVPFLIVLVFFVLAGIAMRAYAPQASSLGEVWEHRQQSAEDDVDGGAR